MDSRLDMAIRTEEGQGRVRDEDKERAGRRGSRKLIAKDSRVIWRSERQGGEPRDWRHIRVW